MMSIDNSFRAAFLAAAVFGCATGAAAAADTHPAWEGIMEITGATPGCAAVGGAAKGDIHVSVYRPKLSPTDTPTYLAILHARAELTLQNDSDTTTGPQMNNFGTYTATAIDGRGKPFTYSGTFSGFVVSPKPVLASYTGTVTVTGTISNYFNAPSPPGCAVTFTATYGIIE